MQYSNQNTFALRINEKCQRYHENPLISKGCILHLMNIPCDACQKLHCVDGEYLPPANEVAGR